LSPQFNSFARSSYSAKRKPLYRCFFFLFQFTGSLRPFVRLSVTKLVNETFWKRINWFRCKLAGTNGRRNKDMTWSTLGSGGQRSRSHGAEIGYQNPFWRHLKNYIQRILAKPGKHITIIPTVWHHLGYKKVKAKVNVFIWRLIGAFFIVPHTQGAQALITQCYLRLHQCLPLPRKC